MLVIVLKSAELIIIHMYRYRRRDHFTYLHLLWGKNYTSFTMDNGWILYNNAWKIIILEAFAY